MAWRYEAATSTLGALCDGKEGGKETRSEPGDKLLERSVVSGIKAEFDDGIEQFSGAEFHVR